MEQRSSSPFDQSALDSAHDGLSVEGVSEFLLHEATGPDGEVDKRVLAAILEREEIVDKIIDERILIGEVEMTEYHSAAQQVRALQQARGFNENEQTDPPLETDE